MMRYKMIMILIVVAFVSNGLYAQKTKKIFSDAEQQVLLLNNEVVKGRNTGKNFPRSLEKDSLKLVVSNDWTSGFWPGILWIMYEYSGKQEWKARADEFTRLMIKEPKNRNSHDVGFKVYNSYGNGYRLTGNEEYKKQVIQGAATLVTRFNPKVGCIRSWDFSKWQYPVIIDNMMNLELLFAATRFTGDSSYYKIAVTHANTTLKNHFRADHSSFHVIDYDTVTGAVIARNTAQGYADGSAWARGQAWGLYGYTMCYRETKDPAYLKQADLIAAYILNNPLLPADKIPFWDYNAPRDTIQPRDASAAAIAASALYELSKYSSQKKKYLVAADMILQKLTQFYRSPLNSNHGFILLHSTGHKPANSEVDVPIIYADYYYLEALMRQSKK